MRKNINAAAGWTTFISESERQILPSAQIELLSSVVCLLKSLGLVATSGSTSG